MSVDHDWWFDNEHSLSAKAKDSMLDQFPLETKEFAEVVISRSLMQKALFRLNKHGQVEPHSQKHSTLMVYDASSKTPRKFSF